MVAEETLSFSGQKQLPSRPQNQMVLLWAPQVLFLLKRYPAPCKAINRLLPTTKVIKSRSYSCSSFCNNSNQMEPQSIACPCKADASNPVLFHLSYTAMQQKDSNLQPPGPNGTFPTSSIWVSKGSHTMELYRNSDLGLAGSHRFLVLKKLYFLYQGTCLRLTIQSCQGITQSFCAVKKDLLFLFKPIYQLFIKGYLKK